jgi:predicted ferric reductase
MDNETTFNPTVEMEIRHPSSLPLVLIAAAAGLASSALILPFWMPGLVQSIIATDIKAFWYLSRATAIVCYLMMWLSMVWGLLMTSRAAKLWPGMQVANELHKFISLLGLSLGGLHGLLLLGDKYLNLSFLQILIPFSVQGYRPVWVGIGQLSLYLAIIVVLSFYLRKLMGYRTWRALHFITFLMFISILVHGITAGTDTGTPWMSAVYWISGGSVLFLTFYRILSAMDASQKTIPIPAKNT